MRKNYFAKIVKYIKKVYHIENGLKKITDARVNPKSIVAKAKENKVFDKGTIDGYVVTAIDGTQMYNSDKKAEKHA